MRTELEKKENHDMFERKTTRVWHDDPSYSSSRLFILFFFVVVSFERKIKRTECG